MKINRMEEESAVLVRRILDLRRHPKRIRQVLKHEQTPSETGQDA